MCAENTSRGWLGVHAVLVRVRFKCKTRLDKFEGSNFELVVYSRTAFIITFASLHPTCKALPGKCARQIYKTDALHFVIGRETRSRIQMSLLRFHGSRTQTVQYRNTNGSFRGLRMCLIRDRFCDGELHQTTLGVVLDSVKRVRGRSLLSRRTECNGICDTLSSLTCRE